MVAPTVTLTLGGLAANRLKLASGLFNLMRTLGGAIGIAACGTIINDRTNLHFLRLAEHLHAGNAAMTEMMHRAGALGTQALGDVQQGHLAALRLLRTMTLHEAQTQAFADAFLAICVCFVFATCMVPLLRKVGRPAAPSADAH